MGEDSNDITQRVDRICEAMRALLLAVAVPPEREINEEAEETRRALAVIRAKEFISVPEAALLLGCSDSHLHNQIQAAIDGTAEHPIPFADLDGTGGGLKRLPREKLLVWSEARKRKRPVKTRGEKKPEIESERSDRPSKPLSVVASGK